MKEILIAVFITGVVFMMLFIMLVSGRKNDKHNKTGNVKFKSSLAPRMIPNADKSGTGKWGNPDSSTVCRKGFETVSRNLCQTNPGSDFQKCSDYPYVFCDNGTENIGELQPMGDLNSVCSYDGSIAYDILDCDDPRKTDYQGSILCGGNTGHPCNNGCTGIAPPGNPWNATGSC